MARYDQQPEDAADPLAARGAREKAGTGVSSRRRITQPAAPSEIAPRSEAATVPAVEQPPPPDAGEPLGARDSGRPAMLGSRFRATIGAGMAIGLCLALLAHWRFSHTYISRDTNGWSWLLAGIGGIAVGGAFTLFVYGVTTDRSDAGPKRRGQAAVSTEGEDRKSRRRRARGGRARGPRD
jgi:hypothetical protein